MEIIFLSCYEIKYPLFLQMTSKSFKNMHIYRTIGIILKELGVVVKILDAMATWRSEFKVISHCRQSRHPTL